MKKTPIGYYGGKQRLAGRICALINSQGWITFTEVFAGGAAVFFVLQNDADKKRRYVLNDKNELIANFYEVAKTPASCKKLLTLSRRRGIFAETHHTRAKQIWHGAKADKIERAWAVFYLGKTSLGADFDRGFKFDNDDARERGYPKVLQTHIAMLAECTDALEKAVILQRDAIDAARKFDKPNTVHYFDPPYISVNRKTGKATNQGHYGGYTADDFARLLEFCGECTGRFVLSHYANPTLTDAIAAHGWNVLRIKTHIGSCMQKVSSAVLEREELLVYNFAAEARLV